MRGAPPGAQTIANQATINDIFGREGERQRERDIQQKKALSRSSRHKRQYSA
ncbi:hypothetical protein F5883DRAFT_586643 [Diaporthe sp. PMI_573]|nr:hypothetical protein F5883DRAFT_586643 [Diaporthaceae sp. PMI_573]